MAANLIDRKEALAVLARPTWTTWREALRVVTHPAHARKTITIALVIGTVFVAINQLPVFLSGHADGLVFAKAVMTYLTPFCVSNYSILAATRSPRQRDR